MVRAGQLTAEADGQAQATDPPESSPRSRRPALAAVLSFVWPGLGQAYRGQRSRAVWQALPPATVVLAVVALVLAIGPLLFGLYLLNPLVSLGAIAVIAGLAAWRAYSIADAARPRTTVATATVLLLVTATLIGHGWLAANAWAFYEAGQRISEPIDVAAPEPTSTPDATSSPRPGATPAPTVRPTPEPTATPVPLPGASDRVTVLLVGVDNTHGPERGLTDTLIVASFDPLSKSLTMISIPRDVARLPLYSGGQFNGRVNNLMRTAARNPDLYPDGGMGTLVNELSYIVGIPIDYYAQIDIAGFTTLVDSVGGVDVVLDKPIRDDGYQFTPTEVGFFLEPGEHHLDGKLATAYARSRHGPGNSDYERAARQQQILLALRAKLDDPQTIANLPAVLSALSSIVRTDAPLDRLPEIASIALSTTDAEARRIVLSPPRYAQGARDAEGRPTTATELRLDAVAALSIELFGTDSRYFALPE